MACSPQIQSEEATYQVMAQGNRGEAFSSGDDRKAFVKTLGQVTVKSDGEILAWGLPPSDPGFH